MKGKPNQRECKLCRLSKRRIQVVVSDGGIRQCNIAFVGEAPGEEEDESGVPFVGQSGRLLREHISNQLGIKLGEDAIVLNTVSCRPPRNRQPRHDEKKICRDWLKLNLGIINPKIVVAVGKHAMSTFVADVKYHKTRGIFFGKDYLTETWQRYNFKVIQIYHPGYILRNRNSNKFEEWHEQMRVIKRMIKMIREA